MVEVIIGAMLLSLLVVGIFLFIAYLPLYLHNEPVERFTSQLEEVTLLASRRASFRLVLITFVPSVIVDTIIAYFILQNGTDGPILFFGLLPLPVLLLITLLCTVHHKLRNELFDSSYLILKARWDKQENRERIKRETKEYNLKRMDELDEELSKW